MPDKEGSDDEKKSTKSVVNKKQKQFLNQEELDLTKIAETFGGYLIEIEVKRDKSGTVIDVETTAAEKELAKRAQEKQRKIFQKAKADRLNKLKKDKDAEVPPRRAVATDPEFYGRFEPAFPIEKPKVDDGTRTVGGRVKVTKVDPRTLKNNPRGDIKPIVKTKVKPKPRVFSYMRKPSPEAQKRITAVKKEIDMKNIITPDRRKKSSRVATSSPDFGEPTIPKKPKPQLEPLTGRDFKRFRKQQQTAVRTKVRSDIDKKIAQVATTTKTKKKIATPIVKTLGKETGEAAVKSAGKKAMRKGVARALSKQIPGVGSLIAGGEAAYRAAKGDMTGAGLSLAQAVPGLGIGAAVADVARDMKRAKGGARVGQKVAKQVATALPGTKFAKKVKTAKKVKVVNPTVVGSAADTAAQAQKFIRNPKNMTAVMGAGAVLGKGVEMGSRKTFQAVKPKDVKGGRVGRRSAKQ